MLSFPNAKINLGLNIVERRPDNFHNIETIFLPVGLSDVLEILVNEGASEKVQMSITGLPIQGDTEKNLCVKAYHLLDKDFRLPPVRIMLHKIIPMGAGLGGGSSDGAFVLKMLNELFELRIEREKLAEYASHLGSDCTFFIENKPAFGTGKGDILEPVSLDITGYFITIVKPDVFVGTAEAYAGVSPDKPSGSLKDLIQQPVTEWRYSVVNDFEASILKKYPQIENIKNTLYDRGALYASMTGSGSAVFGIFNKELEWKDEFKGSFVWSGKM